MTEVPIRVVLNRANHGVINIQGAREIVAAVTTAYSESSGNKVFYDETFPVSVREAAETERMIRTKGFLYYSAAEMLKTNDGPRIYSRMQQFTGPTDAQLVNYGIIAPNNLCRFFIFRGLEDLRQAMDISYIQEAHDPQSLQKLIAKYKADLGIGKKGTEQWYGGDFGKSVESNKVWHRERFKMQTLREPDMYRQLKTALADIAKDPEGGILFINVGFTHAFSQLRDRKYGAGASLVFEEINAVPETFPELVIDQALRQGRYPEGVMYARDLFIKRGLETLAQDGITRGRLLNVGEHFGSITTLIADIAENLSVADIRRFCEQKQAFRVFISQFPQGEMINALV